MNELWRGAPRAVIQSTVEPTSVRIGLMDSRRPGLVEVLPARHLSFPARAWRAMKTGFVVGVCALLATNFAMLVVPIPWVHFCTVPIALIIGPLMAFVTWRQRVLLKAAQIGCPRCREKVDFPEGKPGWPARQNCLKCGIMVELDAAR